MPVDDATRREIRKQRQEAGLCTTCGKRPPVEGRTTCSVCCGYFAKYRSKRNQVGECQHCPGQAVPGKRNCEACLAKQREYNRRYRDAAIAAYGGRCRCCGETTDEFLQIDHVNNDGAEHRRKIGNGNSIYTWLKKNNYPEGFQVLCANCNYAKAHYGYCPHRPDMEVNRAPRKRKPDPHRHVSGLAEQVGVVLAEARSVLCGSRGADQTG